MQPMSKSKSTRPFAAGGFTFDVATSDDSALEMIERLLGDLPPPPQGEQALSRFELSVARSGTADRWHLAGPRLEEQPETSLVGVMTLLVSAINLCALDSEPASLHLHAAAAVKEGGAVILAAERNTGKTTTVAHLIERGWGFITDETVRLPSGSDGVGGFPKPLSIKPGGETLVGHLAQWMMPALDEEGESVRFVPIGATGARIAESGSPRLAVLLRRRQPGEPGSNAVARKLHPADAVVALMQETLDAERFGTAAVRLAQLVASTPCYEMTMGNPGETADLVEVLFDQPRSEPMAVELQQASEALAEGVVSVAIGDRTAVHHLGTGAIFALDEPASKVWEQVAGLADHGIDLAGPVVAEFVQQLKAMKVLADSSPQAGVDL